MNAQKELQLRDTYERFMNLMMDDLSLDELNKVAEREVMGYGTTIDERIFEIEGLRNIIIAQREQACRFLMIQSGCIIGSQTGKIPLFL